MEKQALNFLDFLNEEFKALMENYEKYFWIVYTKDNSKENQKAMTLAESEKDDFINKKSYLDKIDSFIGSVSTDTQKRLLGWKSFFNTSHESIEAREIKSQIIEIESQIGNILQSGNEGFIDPYSKEFISMSRVNMMDDMTVNTDELYRKSYFEALEGMVQERLEPYLQLIQLRNRYANLMGYEDFYDFKVQTEDGMTKDELFSLLEKIEEKTQPYIQELREMNTTTHKNVLYPWNYEYMTGGEMSTLEDPFFQIETILKPWMQTMHGLGIDYQGGTMRLDLIARSGKYDNGFCHQPKISSYNNGKFIGGDTNFTCNAVVGQIGSGFTALETLFHEGGHAAHFMNMAQQDYYLNSEFNTATALAEVQSMLLDSLCVSPEWLLRYPTDASGNSYTFEMYKKRLQAFKFKESMQMLHLSRISFFEKEIYETKDLSIEKIKDIAIKTYKRCTGQTVDSLEILLKPHLYSHESSCQYHGYKLAMLGLEQWKNHFYKTYGYIIDNPNIGKDMQSIWEKAGSISLLQMMELATGEKLKTDAFIANVLISPEEKIRIATDRLAKMDSIPKTESIDLNANIEMWHGNEKITDNTISNEVLIQEYADWLKTQ